MKKVNADKKVSEDKKDADTLYKLVDALIYKESDSWYLMDDQDKNAILKFLFRHDEEIKEMIGSSNTIKEYMELQILYSVVNGFDSRLEDDISNFVQVYPNILDKKFSFYDYTLIPNFDEGYTCRIEFGKETTLLEVVDFVTKDDSATDHIKLFGCDYDKVRSLLKKYSKAQIGVRV